MAFVPPFGRLRGDVHGSSMARRKERDRLPISANWTFIASSHDRGAMSWYLSKSFCSKLGGGRWTVGHFERKFLEEWGPHSSRNGEWPTNDCWRQKTRVPRVRFILKKETTGCTFLAISNSGITGPKFTKFYATLPDHHRCTFWHQNGDIAIGFRRPGLRIKAKSPILPILTPKLVAMATSFEPSGKGGSNR